MIKKLISSFALTAGILTALMAFLKFAPFGGNSFAVVDAIIQYLDFFQYFQNVINGNIGITFTFDKGLGGNMFAVVTYYLMSPLNFLIMFFRPDEMHTLYDWLVVLKVSLSATTMTYYLEKRFDGRLSTLWNILLSVSFGLMEYNLHQARNIMWLDAVYMLPLMLLGMHKVRTTGRITYLTITTALAILFNWYSGLIAAMFVGLFSIWEYIVFSDKEVETHELLRFICKVAGSIILAVGLNAILFVPTMKALAAGRGHIDWGFFNLGYFGRPLNILQGLTWGSISERERVALFTGDLVTFGVVAFFIQKNINRRLLIGGAVLVGFIFLMFYWRPVLFIFSLLKDPNSYFYRYSYLASFMMIYLTALFLIHRQKLSEWRFDKKKFTLLAFSVYPLVIIIRQFTRPINSLENVLLSAVVYIIIAACFYFTDKMKSAHKIFLILFTIVGLICNALLIIPQMQNDNVASRQNYVVEHTKLINQLKEYDNSVYRTSQARDYSYYSPNDPFAVIYRTANYNEGLAYNYKTISTYTSSPINAHLWLLDHLGYKKNGDNFNIINTSVLPADSLLGVKYILSDIPVDGVKPINELAVYNKNVTYKNDFAFPLAFVCNDTNFGSINYNGNPFEYTNELYSKMFGEKMRIYNEIPYQSLVENDKRRHYGVQPSGLSGAIYGNMNHDENFGGLITIDDIWMYQVFAWMGTSAFFVPHSAGQEMIHVQLDTERELKEEFEPYFYIVDETQLAKARDKAQARAVTFETFNDNKIKMTISGKAGEKLFTTIPYEGWEIVQNDKVVDAEIVLNGFVGLTLDEGENIIEMTYSMPAFLPGCLISIVSLIILVVLIKKRPDIKI